MKIKLISRSPQAIYLSMADCQNTPLLHIEQGAFASDKILYCKHFHNNYFGYYKQKLRLNKVCPDSLDKREIRHLDGTYLYLDHIFSSNYSHFTINCLAGFLYAKDIGVINEKIKIIIDDNLKFQRELIELLGINNYKICNLEDGVVYSLQNVIFADSLISHDFCSPHIISLYEQQNKLRAKKSDLKLYIHRLSDKKRKIVNELEVIGLLKAHGFKIIDFGTLSITEQMEYINRASVLCAPHGASGANLIYRNKEKFKFIEIFPPDYITACHTSLLKVKNCDYVGVVASFSNEDKSSYRVDVKTIEEALSSICFSFSCHTQEKETIPHSNRGLQAFYSYEVYEDGIADSAKAESRGQFDLACEFLLRTNISTLPWQHIFRLFKLASIVYSHDEYIKTVLPILTVHQGHGFIERLLFHLLNYRKFEDFERLFAFYEAKLRPEESKRLLNKLDLLRKYPLDSLLTFHGTILASDNTHIYSSDQLDNYISYQKDSQGFTLKLTSGKYINGFRINGQYLYPVISINKFYFPFISFNHSAYAIISNGEYISASPNKSISLVESARDWEYLYIVNRLN